MNVESYLDNPRFNMYGMARRRVMEASRLRDNSIIQPGDMRSHALEIRAAIKEHLKQNEDYPMNEERKFFRTDVERDRGCVECSA